METDDLSKPFRFMINSNPDKEVLLEDTWINLKGIEGDIDNGPKIRVYKSDKMPGYKFAVAYTSKKIMEDLYS